MSEIIEKEIKYYIHIFSDEKGNKDYGFIIEDEDYTPGEGEYLITKSDYDTFFTNQSNQKCYKLKDDPTGTTLFDYVEESTPKQETQTLPLTNEEQQELKRTVEALVLAALR